MDQSPIFEIDEEKHYAVVYVEWEWTTAKYVIEVQYADPELDDVIATFDSVKTRDEGYRIYEFKMI